MRQLMGAAAAACLAAAAWGATTAPKPTPVPQSAPTPRHWGLLDRYCSECHNTVDWAGGVAFDALDPASLVEDAETWEKAIRKMRTGMMPPAGEPRPPRAQLDRFSAELEARLDAAGLARPHPGTKSLHRLNRTEYRNAIRDLLSYDLDVSTLLPADDAAEGFDNIADVLGVSPTLIQGYVSASMKISRWAVGDRSMAPVTAKYVGASGPAQRGHVEGLPLGTRGGTHFTHIFPLDAEYEFRVSAGSGFRFAGPAGAPPPKVDITLNGERVSVEDPRKFRLRVKAGPQAIGIGLVEQRRSDGEDELYAKSQPRRDDFESVTITGPFDASGPGDTPSRRAIFTCYPKEASEEGACAREVLSRLASRAFRRPLAPTELDGVMKFYETGARSGGFEVGIQQGLSRLLADPRFLYRMESDRADLQAGTTYRISDLELATRLSFFLWSSIPDEELLRIATEGKLHEPAVLERQVRRMLADSRSDALVENFAGQWLHLRELHNAQPLDREFDENLRDSFEQETRMLFGDIVREDRSLLGLLDANYTWVNERLARHYGIPDVRGGYMRRVALAKDSPRRGLLGQGSILTVTSAGNRTSPVMRGSWVLETLLGAPPPRPPPGVEADLKEEANAVQPKSVRDRLELHRENPTCASCHQIMDPIGFSLENFDLIGRWREKDGAVPVDASGTLIDGTQLGGAQDLRRMLLDHSDSFVTSASEKLMTYALGRRIEYFDQPSIRKIVRDSRREDYRFSSLVLGVVNSVPFQMKVRQ